MFAWFVEGASVCRAGATSARLGDRLALGPQQLAPSTVRGLLTNPVYTGQVFGNRLRTRPVERRRSALRPVGRGGGEPPRERPGRVDRRGDRAGHRRSRTVRARAGAAGLHSAGWRGETTGFMTTSCAAWSAAATAAVPAQAGTCGGATTTMSAEPRRRPRRRRRVRIARRLRHIPGRPLEELVWRDLCEVLATPEMVVHAMERARGGHWLPQEMQARRANLRRGQGGAAAADRAAHGSLPCWRRAAERVRAPPTGRRGSAGRARWPGTRAHPRHGSSGRDRSPRGSCRGVLPARAAGPGAGGFRPQAGAAGTARSTASSPPTKRWSIRYVIPVGPEGERDPFCLLRTDYQCRLPGCLRPLRPGSS